MDSARAAMLYVSNRHEDHPQADFAAQIASKARTDSIYAARSTGVMAYRKTSYKSPVDGMEIRRTCSRRSPRAATGRTRRWCGCTRRARQMGPDFSPSSGRLGRALQSYVIVAHELPGSTGLRRRALHAIDYGAAKEVDGRRSALRLTETLPCRDSALASASGGAEHGGSSHLRLLQAARTPFKAAERPSCR
jgi:hypothetical protein